MIILSYLKVVCRMNGREVGGVGYRSSRILEALGHSGGSLEDKNFMLIKIRN